MRGNMNQYRLVLFLVVSLLFCNRVYSEEKPFTQGQMNQVARAEFWKADARLNAVYKKILASLEGSEKRKLVFSQRAWVVYRDAEADFEAEVEATGGTMTPTIYNSARERMTDERIKQLRNPATSPDSGKGGKQGKSADKAAGERQATDWAANFKEADERLSAVHKHLVDLLEELGKPTKIYNGEILTIDISEDKKKLEASVAAWSAFRDAEAAFVAETVTRKSNAAAAYDKARALLTEARIKELQEMADFVKSDLTLGDSVPK